MNKGLYGFQDQKFINPSPQGGTIDDSLYGLSYSYNFGIGIQCSESNVQYATVPKLNTSVKRPEKLALSIWFRMTDTSFSTIDVTPKGLFSTHNSGSNYFNFHCGKSGGNLAFNLFYGNAIGGADSWQIGASAVLDTTTEHNVWLMHEGNTMKFWLDGVYRDSATVLASKLPSTFFNTEIGRVYAINSRILPGIVGDTRIFEFLPPDLEIESHYNNGLGRNNLDKLEHMLWLPFNGNESDYSGNFRNATLFNKPLFPQFII